MATKQAKRKKSRSKTGINTEAVRELTGLRYNQIQLLVDSGSVRRINPAVRRGVEYRYGAVDILAMLVASSWMKRGTVEIGLEVAEYVRNLGTWRVLKKRFEQRPSFVFVSVDGIHIGKCPELGNVGHPVDGLAEDMILVENKFHELGVEIT